MRSLHLTLSALLALTTASAGALEYPIGSPHSQAGIEVAAVYLQAVEMDPGSPMRRAVESDIHLEADIHALGDNPNGFPEGAWVPYLRVRYELTKAGGGEPIRGEMMAMVASDGPHYGDNVKLRGPGKYTLKLRVEWPGAATTPHAAPPFGRHTDRATGVAAWPQPIEASWDFVYAGVGKKGGY